MCGIAGAIHLTGEPVDEAVLSAMTRRLSHRGPDVQNIRRVLSWAGLGHARLKVIDLSDAANQPMGSADGNTWIVYNGEVYNYRVLRAELEAAGARFVSQSDTEVILHAYRQWGEACVERLDGMFAFAILDVPRRRLLLARDRTGKKPLFYYFDGKRLLFASEIKALAVHPAVALSCDEQVIPLYLTYGYVPAPQTWYAQVKILEPACRMTVDLTDGAQRLERYWQWPLDAQPPKNRAEAADELRRRLTQAVQRRLASDVPLGAFLSGGLDSTVVVGLMRKLMREPPHTFTIGFRGDARFDETAPARLVARHFGTRHTEFIVEPKAFELIERLVYHHDQPFGDASAIPTFVLCGLAREHVTVALNGDGGDELFAGYRRFVAAALSARLPHWGIRAARGALRSLPARLGVSGPLGEARRFLEVADRPWQERLVRWISYFADARSLLRPELAGRIAEDAWLGPARRWLPQAAHRPPLAQALYWNFQEYLPNDLHVKMDRCSMAHGLETRSPLLDTAVVELAASLPDNWQLEGFKTKAFFRRTFADLLPPPIQQRGKQGFGVPLDAWFRGELREVVSGLLLSPAARLTRYIDAQALKRLCEAHLRGGRNAGLQLWNLSTLEIWLQMHERGAWSRQPPPAVALPVRVQAVRAYPGR